MKNERHNFQSTVTELLSGDTVPHHELIAVATNFGADHDNWHTRESFESRIQFHQFEKLSSVRCDEDRHLFALIDDGRAEGAVWFPVEICPPVSREEIIEALHDCLVMWSEEEISDGEIALVASLGNRRFGIYVQRGCTHACVLAALDALTVAQMEEGEPDYPGGFWPVAYASPTNSKG